MGAGGEDGELVARAFPSASGLMSRVMEVLPTGAPATISDPGNEAEPSIP